MLMIVTLDAVHVRKMIRYERQLNPEIEIVIRSHHEEEAVLVQKEVIGKVFYAKAKSLKAWAIMR